MIREAWLQGVIAAARPYFKSHGTPLPRNISISVGWCKHSANSLAGCVYAPDGEKGQTGWEVYINPDVPSGRLVVCIILHELIHIAVAPYIGHRGPFRELATALGFGRVLTYTTEASLPPAMFLDHLMDGLGRYPHRLIMPRKAP